VAHDRVGAEVREVLGLLGRRHPGQRADRRRAAGAALVEEQDAVVLQRALQPRRVERLEAGTKRLEARAALEGDEQRFVDPVPRANRSMRSPSGFAWSSGTVNACSLSTQSLNAPAPVRRGART